MEVVGKCSNIIPLPVNLLIDCCLTSYGQYDVIFYTRTSFQTKNHVEKKIEQLWAQGQKNRLPQGKKENYIECENLSLQQSLQQPRAASLCILLRRSMTFSIHDGLIYIRFLGEQFINLILPGQSSDTHFEGFVVCS